MKKQGRIHGCISCVRLGRGSKKSLLASKQQNTRLKIDVNRPTDRPTDIASYRVAGTRLKMRMSALRKNPGFSIGRALEKRIFRLNADNLTGKKMLKPRFCHSFLKILVF